MKTSPVIGSLALLLALSLPAAPAQKPAFQTAKEQALGLRGSLMSAAAPGVRAKIAASAEAARTYLAKCGRSCDLHAFLTKEIGRRFTPKKDAESRLLETIIFAETLSEMSELDQMALQDEQQKQQQLIQTISQIMKMSHDTLKAIIQNMRG